MKGSARGVAVGPRAEGGRVTCCCHCSLQPGGMKLWLSARASTTTASALSRTEECCTTRTLLSQREGLSSGKVVNTARAIQSSCSQPGRTACVRLLFTNGFYCSPSQGCDSLLSKPSELIISRSLLEAFLQGLQCLICGFS